MGDMDAPRVRARRGARRRVRERPMRRVRDDDDDDINNDDGESTVGMMDGENRLVVARVRSIEAMTVTRAVGRLFTDDDERDERGDAARGSESEGEYEDEGPRAGDVVAFFAPPSGGRGELRAYSARGERGEIMRGNVRPVIRDAKDVAEFLPCSSSMKVQGEDAATRLGVEDASTQLEVLRYKKYFGFRSHAAGGKLLQARRRLDSKLCFFNFNFGVCEQWALVDVENARFGRVMTFRNRRLEAVTIRVIVQSISRKLLPMYALETVDNYEDELEHIERVTSTPRRQSLRGRLAPPPGESPPPVAPSTSSAASIYDVLSTHRVSEWTDKLSAEIEVRRGVENELGALRDDLKAVYEGTMIEVQSMRGTLDDFKAKTAVRIDAQGKASIRAIQNKAVQRISTSSARLHRNFSFRHWKAYTQQARMERMAVVRFMIRKDGRQINLVFSAWKVLAQYLAGIRRKDAYARARNNKRHLSRYFSIWKEIILRDKLACRIAKRAHILGVAEKRRELKLKVVCAWRVLAKQNHHAMVLKHRVVGRMRQQLVAKAFNSWRQNARIKHLHELALSRYFSKTDRRIVYEYFHKWLNTINNTKVLTRRLLRVFNIWDNRTAYAALSAWKDATRARRSQKVKLGHIVSRMRNVKIRGAWDKWIQVTAEGKRVIFHDDTVKNILQKLIARRLLVQWRMLTRKEIEADNNRIVRHRFIVLNRAFLRWKCALQMKEDMKRMVTAKRVTNNLFLDWHWSVFGEEFTALLATRGVSVIDASTDSPSKYYSPEESTSSKLLWSPPKPRRLL